MPPAVILSLTIATLYGSAFHVVAGRRFWQWPVFWAAAVAGFFAGFAGGVAIGLELLRLGSIPLLAATLGSGSALAIAWWATTPFAQR